MIVSNLLYIKSCSTSGARSATLDHSLLYKIVFFPTRISTISFISVPVIRVKPVKNHLVMVLIESGVGLATILPQLVAM